MIKMTLKNKIVELVSKKELNAVEISAELNVPKNNLMVYLFTLVKEGKIERTTDKKPYKYKAIKNETNDNCKELLKELYEIMIKMSPIEKLSEIEVKTIEKINEVLEID